MTALLRNFAVPRLDYSESREIPVLTKILQAARAKGISTHRRAAGGQEFVGEVAIDILHPPKGNPSGSVNDNSMVMRLNFGAFSALFTGDLEEAGEKSLLELDSDVSGLLLKVAHHGSRSAAGEAFIDRVRPKWAIISSGRGNPFGNPSKEVVLRLLHQGVKSLVTSDQGAIFFETDGTQYVLSSYVSGLLEAGLLP
jgi:competence protein ComEC